MNLSMWTIYDSPSDFPGKYVARRFEIEPNRPLATSDHIVGPTLESVRAQLPPGLYRMDRVSHDEPHVVEVWL